jgi:hypothetical protein
VFTEAAISTPVKSKIPVKIINTRNVEVQLKNFSPQIFLAKGFKIQKFSKQIPNFDIQRAGKLIKSANFDSLNPEEKAAMQTICSKFSDVFHLDSDKLSTTNLYKQRIRLKPDSMPIFIKPYRLPHSQKEEIHSQITKMLENDIIEKTSSEWSSPVLVVPKKSDEQGNKNWRVVIDYRKLNEQIINDKFPIANITDILDSLGKAIYFSTLDLSQGFYQLEILKSC